MTRTSNTEKRRKKLVDSNGLRFNIWFYFILFCVCIIAVMWFFEFVFLKGYYGTMKRNDVRKICREIVAGYQRLGSAYETDIDEYARLNGMYVSLYNGSGTLLFTYPNYSGSGVKQNLLTESQRKELLSRLKGDEDNEVCEIAANAENEEDTFVTYGAVFDFDGAEYMLYAQASLGSINATTVILASQLLLTTIIALALAFVLSAFLSRQLSKPIVLMSQSAQHLASGDYTVRFEGSGYTELDELSDTLNFATEEMQRVETLRQDLLANISHDLKTPLTIIKSYAELIKDITGDNKAKREEQLDVIIDEAKRLTELVNEILVVSQQNSTSKLNKTDFDFSELVESVVKKFDFDNSGYNFRRDVKKGLWVNADRHNIEQVLFNFISNAVKDCGKDKEIIIVVKEAGGSARFDVFDHGNGISKQEQKYIWDRFSRASQKYKRGDSTGLGLSIVRSILKSHDAVFGVNSAVGKGSDFYFELPLVEPPQN